MNNSSRDNSNRSVSSQTASAGPSYRKVFWSAGFGWMFDAMDVGLLSFILVQLSAEWGLTPTEKGLLGAATMVGMAIGAPLGGYWADRAGRRKVFLLTLLLFGAASLASAFSPGLAVMLVLRLLMGLGLGAELPVASTLVSELAPPEKRGRTVVLLESFWAAGWIVAAVIAYFIMPDYGWRTAVIVGGIPVIYALIIRRRIPESPKTDTRSGRVPVRNLFTRFGRRTAVLWIVWFAVAFSYYGMFLWLPSVLVAKGFTMISSFRYVLLMTLAQLPGYFASAWLVERWGRKPTLALFLAMTAVCAYVFGASESASVLLVSGAFLSFFNLGAWGALYAYTPENYPAEVRASGSGFAAGFGRVGSVIAPYLVGYLVAAKVGYGPIFAIFTAVIAVGVVVLVLFGRETKGSAAETIPQASR